MNTDKKKLELPFNKELHPLAAIVPRMAQNEFEGLCRDIKKNGLRVAIVLDASGRVVDGRHRLLACKQAKVTPTPDQYVTLGPDVEVWSYIVSAAAHRRHLTKAQRFKLLKAMPKEVKQAIETEAKAKKAAGQKSGGRGKKKLGGKTSSKFSAAKAKGEAVGLSESDVRAKERIDREDPELAKQVEDGKATVGAALRVVKAKTRARTKVTPKPKPTPTPAPASNFDPLDHEYTPTGNTPAPELWARLESYIGNARNILDELKSRDIDVDVMLGLVGQFDDAITARV